MHVYTEEFLKKATAYCKGRPRYMWSTAHAVAMLEEHLKTRAEIEKLVLLIPDGEKRDSVVSRLQAPEGFIEAYNELKVGDLFDQIGCEIEYERPIANPSKPGKASKTPDWFVYTGAGFQCYVEVLTNNPSKENSDIDRAWKRLFSRITDSIQGVAVELILRNNVPPTEGKAKAIITRLQRWLEANPEAEIRERIWHNIDVAFLRLVAKDKPDVFMYFDAYCLWKAPLSLENKILEKTKRYQFLETMRIPLVVAVVPNDIVTGVHMDDLEPLLNGNRIYDPSTGSTIQRDNGTFSKTSALSAMIWVPKRELGTPIMPSDVSVFYNAHATNPIQVKIL